MRTNDSRHFFLRALKGDDAGARALRLPLLPLSWAYGALLRARRAAYRCGLAGSHTLDVPVISIGNLTAGGTGKTPMVEWLARRLVEMGRKPAILSRGYGAQPGARKNDEVLMLERRLPNIGHYADPDRVASGKKAVAAGADCLILDDGFQHLRVKRGLNLLLIDATDPFGGGRVLPAGLLREPLAAMRDADAVLLTRAEAVTPEALTALRAEVERRAPGKPIMDVAFRSLHVLDLAGGTREPADSLKGRRVLVACAIGNPEAFRRTVESLGADVADHRFWPDHNQYDAFDLMEMLNHCHESGAEFIIVTEKDAVKLAGIEKKLERFLGQMPGRPGEAAEISLADLPIRVLEIEAEFVRGRETIETLIRDTLCSSKS